jgi:hypothetical protein
VTLTAPKTNEASARVDLLFFSTAPRFRICSNSCIDLTASLPSERSDLATFSGHLTDKNKEMIQTHDELVSGHPTPDQYAMKRHPNVQHDVLDDLYHASMRG